MNEAYFITAGKLAKKGKENIPDEFSPAKGLIYSSPATLAYNSPGAKGYGVKRAGLSVPESVMLLISPCCCGRNTSLFRTDPEYRDKMFFLLLDDNDIITGRHLAKIPQAAEEIISSLEKKPSVLMLCITCVDALLGTDMESICRQVTKKTGIPSAACYMYALTRESTLPPMTAVRKTVYSFLKKYTRCPQDMNILGYFTPLSDETELFDILHEAGIKNIRELSRCQSFDEYKMLSKANFNLVLDPEALYAARDIYERLGIPFIGMNRVCIPEKISSQYELLGKALGIITRHEKYHKETLEAIASFKAAYPALTFSIGEMQDFDPLECAYMLAREGYTIAEIFASVNTQNFGYIRLLAQISPETRIYSNLSPTMIYYEPEKVDLYIGSDSKYYHSQAQGIEWCNDHQPFGYSGVIRFFDALENALSGREPS